MPKPQPERALTSIRDLARRIAKSPQITERIATSANEASGGKVIVVSPLQSRWPLIDVEQFASHCGDPNLAARALRRTTPLCEDLPLLTISQFARAVGLSTKTARDVLNALDIKYASDILIRPKNEAGVSMQWLVRVDGLKANCPGIFSERWPSRDEVDQLYRSTREVISDAEGVVGEMGEIRKRLDRIEAAIRELGR